MSRLWWIIHKDLACEARSRRAWPAMFLFGVIVAVVFGVQIDLLPDQKSKIAGGLLWLAVFFAGMTAIDHSLASEREEGCWQSLRAYPVSPALIYLAKLAVNVLAIAALECVLIPLFVVLSDVPLAVRPGALAMVAALGNLGIASVGTLVSAMTASARRSGSVLALVVLPLAIPVVLAAAEATRLMSEGDLGAEWWRWIQLLAAFAVVFLTAGVVLFEFVIED
jgi:heme exporter protein B